MTPMEAYVDGFSYALGSRATHVDEAAAGGLTVSAAADLRQAGFRCHHRCGPDESLYDLARAAVAQTAPGRVDAIVYATAIPQNANLAPTERFARSGDVRDLMDFPASRLQSDPDLGLDGAVVVGLAQQACTGMLGSIRLARALLASEPDWQRVLCVTADRFPDGARYEQSYCLVSDGAAACVVSREPALAAAGYRIVAAHQVTNGALAGAGDDETVGAWFGAMHRLVSELVARAGLDAAGVDWVVPQNAHPAAWGVLARLLGIDAGRICAESLADVGHVISADNIVNLTYLERRGVVRAGDTLLLAMAGYGMHWQGLLLEKT
ncbi:MAG: 3-oxoacyl-[acyl-carrier-protein] synthase III C-terminal domain-containing protein [Acidimicrobiales bacterium]